MEKETLTHEDLLDRLHVMFAEMPGEDMVDVWNQLRCDKIEYVGDNLYRFALTFDVSDA